MADIWSYIGFAQKAGRCVGGFVGVSGAVCAGEAKLVIKDEGLAFHTTHKLESVCRRYGVPVVTAREPGKAMGREEIMCVAILDEGLARAIIESLKCV